MHHRIWLAMVAVAAILAPVLTACGSGDDGDAGDTRDCTRVAPQEALVDQDNLKFIPEELCVNAGQAITFKNSESAIHTVTIDGENESGNMRKDDTFEWTPPAAGTYRITCDFHPQMRAAITVRQ